MQSADKVMPARRRDMSAAEALVEIRLAIAIQVVQARDLIAAKYIGFSLGDNESERLMQSRGEAPPANVLQLFVQALDAPHVALHRADKRRAVGQKIVVAE